MLETCRVRRVTCDGNVNALFPHDRNTLADIVRSVAVYFGTKAVRVSCSGNFFEFSCIVVIICLNISKSIDSGNDLCSVLSKTVQNNAERFLTNLVRLLSDTDRALCSRKRLVACKECEAVCLLLEEHLSEVTMSKTYFTLVCN